MNYDVLSGGKGNAHGLGASGTDLRGLGGVKGDSQPLNLGVRLTGMPTSGQLKTGGRVKM